MNTRWTAAVMVGMAMVASLAWADKRLDEAVAKADEQLRKAADLRQKSRTDEADKAIQDAIKTVQKAAEQDPQNPEAQLAFGRILLRTGKRDEAGAAFAKAVKLAPAAGPVRAAVFSGQAAYDLLRGSGEQARKDADAAVKADANAETLALLARAQARVDDPAVALQTADRAVQAGAAVAAAHQAKGEALLAAGRTADAVASLRQATTLAPGVVSAQVSLALALLRDGKAAAAVEVARAAAAADPQSAEALAVQGLAEAKDWNTAISDAQQGVFLDAKSPLAQWVVGQLFEQSSNFDQAIGAYQAAVAVDPGFCGAAAGLVQQTYRTGRDAAAMPWAQKLGPANPFCGGLQLTLGEMLLRKEEYAKALPALQVAAKLLPSSPDANYFYGLAGAYQGQLNEPVAAFGRAVELKPTDLDYRTAFGLALVRAQEIDRAIAELQKVVATPGYNKSDAWINLGYALRMARRAPEAVDAYQKASTIDPKSAPASLGLALSLGQAKRCDDAVPAFRRAIELDPNAKTDSLIQIARCVVTKQFTAKPRDVAAADQAYNEALAVAGPANETLILVKKNLEILRKTPAGGTPGVEAPEEIDVPRFAKCLMSGGKCAAGERIHAVGELKKAGRDGVPYITFALRVDAEPGVRNAARGALESLKGAACAAGPDLKLLARMECPSPCINCPPAEVKRELELCDSINAGRKLGLQLVSSCGVK